MNCLDRFSYMHEFDNDMRNIIYGQTISDAEAAVYQISTTTAID